MEGVLLPPFLLSSNPLHMDIKKSRDETLIKTIDILNQIVTDEQLNKLSSKLVQDIMIVDVLDKVSTAWKSAGDIYNVSNSIEEAKIYLPKHFMFRYKIGELVVHLNKILHPEKKEFSLN